MLRALTPVLLLFFFFNDTATTEIYTLSLHDALPIFVTSTTAVSLHGENETRMLSVPSNDSKAQTRAVMIESAGEKKRQEDRKSTRLNSSHQIISYAVFCLKKKKYKSRTAGYGVQCHV